MSATAEIQEVVSSNLTRSDVSEQGDWGPEGAAPQSTGPMSCRPFQTEGEEIQMITCSRSSFLYYRDCGVFRLHGHEHLGSYYRSRAWDLPRTCVPSSLTKLDGIWIPLIGQLLSFVHRVSEYKAPDKYTNEYWIHNCWLEIQGKREYIKTTLSVNIITLRVISQQQLFQDGQQVSAQGQSTTLESGKSLVCHRKAT